MLTIRITASAVQLLRTIRVWCSRVFALILIVYAMTSAPTAVPTSRSTSVFLRPAVMAAPPHAVRPIPPKPVIIKRPSNTLLCLAQVLYFEASTEPIEGLQAVAATVFNRIGTPGYARSICGVVYQPHQYSWTLVQHNWLRTPAPRYFDLAKAFLQERESLKEEYPVTHYHHVGINPKWSVTLEHIFTIGQHKFYRFYQAS